MTSCIAGKLVPAKDADHKKPIQHYIMAPGTAWKLTSNGREVVKITPEMARRAEGTLCLIWHTHGVAAEFRIGADLYAQPTQAIVEKKRKERASTPRTGSSDVGATACLTPNETARATRRVKKPRRPLFLE